MDARRTPLDPATLFGDGVDRTPTAKKRGRKPKARVEALEALPKPRGPAPTGKSEIRAFPRALAIMAGFRQAQRDGKNYSECVDAAARYAERLFPELCSHRGIPHVSRSEVEAVLAKLTPRSGAIAVKGSAPIEAVMLVAPSEQRLDPLQYHPPADALPDEEWGVASGRQHPVAFGARPEVARQDLRIEVARTSTIVR